VKTKLRTAFERVQRIFLRMPSGGTHFITCPGGGLPESARLAECDWEDINHSLTVSATEVNLERRLNFYSERDQNC